MESEALRLSELICARVCHDLSGLAGTLVSALDLAQEQGNEGGEAVAVAREAADALAHRLRLLRAALGPVSEPLGASGIADLAAGLGKRLRVDVSGLGAAALAGTRARLALAMLLLGAEALPAGGVLRLSGDTAKGALRVAASGPRAAWPPGVAQRLASGVPPRGLNDLLASLCGLLARDAGLGLAAEASPPALHAMPLGRSRG